MGLFSIEHSPAAYRADFWLYASAVLLMAAALLLAPAVRQLELLALAGAGLALWSLAEYLLHRFVLHGVAPFSRWHAEHHRRPAALIGSPTILSATLMVGLVFVPAWWLSNAWDACALSLGVSAGYLGYSLMHHALHHAAVHPGRSERAWLRRRQRWHALHHRRDGRPGCYGVTSPLWDHVFGSADRGAAGGGASG